MLKKLLPYLKPYRWRVAWALSQVFLIAGFAMMVVAIVTAFVIISPAFCEKARQYLGEQSAQGRVICRLLEIIAQLRSKPGSLLVGFGLSVVIALLVSVGATFGGTLVFDYGFNVETAGDSPVWHRSETDVLPGHHD